MPSPSREPALSDPFAQPAGTLADRYRIERELGAGGMATVYLAQDLKHDRQVAIKVLRPELAAVIGAERFLSEIKTTAHLQHPHILPLFDSGAAGPLLYYVMPFIEGESLRERLNREKQLPIADAVRIAGEVASALDYAHRHGIIHRDIKPENVMLHDGQAMVADFGIALAASSAGSRMTETGMSLGTPHYMSPEQAMGERELDARTDVYALGVMTYEMLVGEPPFTGPTAQAIVAKVVTEKPVPPTRLRASIPEDLEDAVLTAIEKLPADRFSSAADYLAAIRTGATGTTRIRRGPAGRLPRTRREIGFTALALGVMLLIGWVLGRGRDAAPLSGEPPTRLALLAPALGGSGGGALYRQFTLARDGASVIFYTSEPGSAGGGLARQQLDSEAAEIMPGTAQIFGPALSPDGRWLAARSLAGDLLLTSLDGTTASFRPVDRGIALFAWHPDGSILYLIPPYRRLMRRDPRQDSSTVYLAEIERPLFLHQVLPDGDRALVTLVPAGTSNGPLGVLDLRSGEVSTLITGTVAGARYTAGWLVYTLPDGSLLGRAFDPGTLALGEVVLTVAQGVSVSAIGESQLDVAANGTLAYIPEQPRSLVRVERDGTERRLVDVGHLFHMPRFSPNGRLLTVDFVTTEGRDVWLLDPEQRTMTRATFEGDGHDATWGPDGRTLTFASSRSGHYSVLRIAPGRQMTPDTLIVTDTINFTGEWLPDGSAMVTVGINTLPESNSDIVLVRNAGRGPIEPLVATRYTENYPAVSPDGRWLAYVSDQSGVREVYLQPIAGGAWQVQVSQGGGDEPMWTPDGRELFYRSSATGRTVMMLAGIATEADGIPVVGSRATLFNADDYLPTTPHANYAVTPDGRAIVAVRRNPSSRIVVIQNLPALMARLRGGAAAP